MKKYIMALDQGTTGSRCIIFNASGEIVAMSKKEFNQIYPKPGWVEHNPFEIWSSLISVATETMAKNGIVPEEIDSIGITNQRETTIVWDKKTGKPIYNAIVWQCRRSAKRIDEIKKSSFSKKIHEKTGLLPDAYFSATKIEWILSSVKGAKEKAIRGELAFGTVDSWIIWNLTRGKAHLTDYTNASRTMLFNIDSLEWDDDLLNYFDIPKSMLPSVQPSKGFFAYTDESVFGVPIPIYGVVGDQQAAMYGQSCFEVGTAKNTYGTGCFVLMNTGSKRVNSKKGLLTTLLAGCTKEKREYALEGSVFMGGALVKWIVEEMELIKAPKESEEFANKVNDNNGVYIIPAFVGLGAPYWDQFARGTVTGLSRGSNKSHFIRATLEAIAYQSYDVIKAMEEDANVTIKSLKVDGGACENNFLMQFQADILETDVIRPNCIESTALGAVFLAGLASGFWEYEKLKSISKTDKKFVPKLEEEKKKELLDGWHAAVNMILTKK